MSLNGISDQSGPTYLLSDVANFGHLMTLPQDQRHQEILRMPAQKREKYKQFILEVRQISSEKGIKNSESILLIYNRESLLTERAVLLQEQQSYLNQASSQLASRVGNISSSSSASAAATSQSSLSRTRVQCSK